MTIALPQLEGSGLITHSRRSCRQSCAKRHWYRYELGVVTDRDSTALRLGSAFHKAIETYYETAPNLRDQWMNEVILGNYAEIPAWALGNPELEHEWQTEAETVGTLARSYVRHWARVDGQLGKLETVAIELPFELPILNPDTNSPTPLYQFAGKIDRIVRLPDGRLAVLETKTTSDSIEGDSDYWQRLRVDTQISGYIVAAQAMGYDVETVVYDVVRKPSIAPKMIAQVDEHGLKIVLDRDGQRVYKPNGEPRLTGDEAKGWTLQQSIETPAQFAERLRADIAERPEFYFARREIVRLAVDINEFLQELWDETQILRFHQKSARWPRNTSACNSPYPCAYRELCFNSIHPLESGLPSGFKFASTLHPELQGESQ